FFFFQAEDGIRDLIVTGVQTCALPISADYVARQLREALPAKVRIESVTGLLPPTERESRIASLVAESGEYVLVCTDCLSEGINRSEERRVGKEWSGRWGRDDQTRELGG